MRHFERDGYHVFEWPDEDLRVAELWERMPALVVGKFLVNTAWDSGSLVPLADSERNRGWYAVGALAHSPRISSPDEIPSEQFEEWLIFETPTKIAEFETLVNFTHFTPVGCSSTEEFETYGQNDETYGKRFDAYWQAIRAVNPLHVIGEGFSLYLITRDTDITAKLLADLK